MFAPTSSNTNIIGRRYQLHNLLGQGGMGAVYRAADRLTGQQVALKRVISPEDTIEFSSSYNLGDFRLALAQEFKLLASLRHPHVIEVLDYGFDGERQPYFTMELLEHAKTVLDAGKGRPLELKIKLIAQMLQALTYLHRRGILHRDLKPANVLVIHDEVKLLDFGLSVMRDHAHDDSGATAGTLAYMSPEVLIGNPATEASDLYAVGMIAFELLAEKYPFNLLDIGALVNHVLYSVPDFTSLGVDIPLTMVLQRLLQKEPPDRYSSANEALVALSEAVEQSIPLETVATRESFLQAARLVGRETEIDQLSTALIQA
ncbi:MAG: serine/threonine protein kinase, partial [Chitinophagaceae bacterium]|nr:serine/threonine protein kinase [Anaerolineae bacterium]